MKDQIFIAIVGLLLCYGILIFTLDLKNYCEYARRNNMYFSAEANYGKSELDYKNLCEEVSKEYIHNTVYEKFLNTFYRSFQDQKIDEKEITEYIKNNTFSHLVVSSQILKLTKCCLYCLALFVVIMVLPNIFFYIMRAFLQQILIYILIVFLIEAMCNFYLNIPLDVMKLIKIADYFDIKSKIMDVIFPSYYNLLTRFFF